MKDIKQALKHAKTLNHQSLFPTPEVEAAYLNRDDQRFKAEQTWCYFIEDAEPSRVYIAFNDDDAFQALVQAIKTSDFKDKTLQFQATEDAPGTIQYLDGLYKQAGMKRYSYNIGMKTTQLYHPNVEPTDVLLYDQQQPAALFQLAQALLDEDSFGMTYTQFQSFLTNSDHHVYVIKKQNQFVGFVLGQVYGDGRHVFIRGLGVKPDMQGRGYGKQLMVKLFSEMAKLGVKQSMLWVDQANHKAVQLYESLGYEAYGDAEAIYLLKLSD